MGTAQGGPQRGDPDRSHMLVGQPEKGLAASLLYGFCSSIQQPAPCATDVQSEGNQRH